MSLISVQVSDKLSPALRTVASRLTGPDRVRASQAMAAEVRMLIVTHLRKLGESRHTTAQRLGATPTGFIAQLAENFDQSSTVAVDAEGVAITMRHPTLVRAVRDVTIVAKNKFLTIPLNALAYGRRVGEFERSKVVLVFKGGHRTGRDKPRKKKSEEEQGVRQDLPAWLLVRSVTQKRDPTLLPTFDEMNEAAARGVKRTVIAALQEAGKL